MKFHSTNKKVEGKTLKEVVLEGLASDGGIYMPDSLPKIDLSFLGQENLEFSEIAYYISKGLFTDVLSEEQIRKITIDTFNFEPKLKKLKEDLYILELFHGPTFAFKDFGAKFMAALMGQFLENDNKKLTILAATSGDTGSAVANGFLNAKNIDVVLLYPKGKVSHIQEKQLTTVGQNVVALEVDGTFDDCQRLVKQAFSDNDLNQKRPLSSANSINIARLIPQSFYYVYAYYKLKTDNILFTVPSGNFGNLTAGLFARAYGLPFNNFIAATNANSVVPDYLSGEDYQPRASIHTISNAMDVGAPSNFSRIVELYDTREKMKEIISGYAISDNDTRETIRNVYEKYNYVVCPHTAVGVRANEIYRAKNNQNYSSVILATASPAKFKDVVEEELKSEVSLPKSLSECLAKKKQSININSSYTEFKKYLLL